VGAYLQPAQAATVPTGLGRDILRLHGYLADVAPSSKQRSTLPSSPTPPRLESNRPSPHQVQGGSRHATYIVSTFVAGASR
jgi:hypothetical protein